MKTAYKYLVINNKNNLTFLNNEIMKTPKKQLHQQILKLCVTLVAILSWSASFGQSPVPTAGSIFINGGLQVRSQYTTKAVTINSNTDVSGTNEYIYLRSGTASNNKWFTDAQMVIGDDWIRIRKPLQFLVYNNSWGGYGEYIQNSKYLDGNDHSGQPYGLSFYTGFSERMRVENESVFVYEDLYVNGKIYSVNEGIFSRGDFLIRGDKMSFEHDDGVHVDIKTNAPLHDDGWIGTVSNHGLFLGTNSVGSNIYLDTHDNVFIGFENDNLPTISDTNLTNFDLLVDEGIIAEDLAIAEREDWADYVFDDAYELKPLDEVQRYIQENNHLPNIPSQKEVSEKGYSVHDVNVKFLVKIEELMLYTIQQEKKIKLQENKIEEQELKMDELSQRLDHLAKLIADNK